MGGAREEVHASSANSGSRQHLYGRRMYKPDQVRLNLALAEEHRFGSGTVYLC